MLQLPSTKYPNVQRTVTGLVDVFPDDVILNCDTATGTVTISLGEIPYNAATGVGNWSTQYKLYINDISNNAATNNITLVAGLGQTINNLSMPCHLLCIPPAAPTSQIFKFLVKILLIKLYDFFITIL